ncbi:MAG: DUF2442 domain-containing protein [Desulfuromonadales bacterium]|nr:DUF2442 domain-containing protein [Desulfuromonadales bacterium]
MLHVVKAEYREQYKIWLEFSDGTKGVADLEDLLWGPVFTPLRDLDRFRKFEVSPLFHTLVWDNGADLAPEALYERAVRNAA